MNIWKLLVFLRQINFAALIHVPDLRDAEATRRWLIECCDALATLVSHTKTTVDDAVVNSLRLVLAKPDAWASLHALLVEVLSLAEADDQTLLGDAADPNVGVLAAQHASPDRVRSVAARTGFSPAAIIAIVQLAVMLVRFFREQRAELVPAE